ncbi:MAG TPA: cytochrome c oxidase subunit II [Methylophilaceae bacterium]|nr:cytochrome c oxidase subunit II [Methylophilaceae bacterium]
MAISLNYISRDPAASVFASVSSDVGVGLRYLLYFAPALPILVLPHWAHAASFQNAMQPAGIQAEKILDLWWLTLGICTVVFIAVLAAFLYAVWRAPRANEQTGADISPLRSVEPLSKRAVLLAVAASTVLLFVLLIADVMTDRALAQLPLGDGIHIELTGHRWWWEARYTADPPSRMFNTANELHIPVGKPVVISLKSSDVIHSFWVPNLHGKKDLIPGRTTTITLRADKPGIYRGQCAEFCGYQHAKMALLVIAEPEAEYEAWAEQQRQSAAQPTTEPAIAGQQIFLGTTCISCHTVQGTPAQASLGPDLTHIASRQTIAAGTLPNTRAHLTAWVKDPQKIKLMANMPSSPLSGDELQAVIAYLETLK